MVRSPKGTKLFVRNTWGGQAGLLVSHFSTRQSKMLQIRNKQHQNAESEQHHTKRGFAYKLRKVKIDGTN